jgi:hypothetical protein
MVSTCLLLHLLPPLHLLPVLLLLQPLLVARMVTR